MRIQPTTGPLDPSPRRWRIAGALWLCATLAGSFYYLLLLQPWLANDLFWPHYNATGYQTSLIDALNQLLETTQDASTVDLASVMLDARYDTLLTTATAHPTYGMALLTTKFLSVDFAIASLRNMSIDNVLWLPTQYCWVDFDKIFELAHTEGRQERCRLSYATNGAVYLDAVVRNIDWTGFLIEYGSPERPFWSAILSGLEASTRGEHWLDTVAAATTSVSEEVTFWKHHGILRFRYQWQNLHLPGLVETATLVNALGIPSLVTLKSTEPTQGPASSHLFYGPLDRDMELTAMCSLSLVRDTPNHFLNTSCLGKAPRSFEAYSYIQLYFGADQSRLVRAALGPFLSIDLLVVSPPIALVSLTRELWASFDRRLNSSSATTFVNLRSLSVSPTPSAWTSGQYVFWAGSLLCSYDAPQTFLQPPFTTTNPCDIQTLWTISVSPFTMVSALSLANDSVESICALVASDACTSSLYQAQTLALRMINQTMVQEVIAATINVSIIQIASDITETNYTLLRQPLLDPSSFAFYGWVLLLDWVAGVREVVSFEGDNGTLVLISDAYDTMPSTSSSSSSLSHASAGVYYIVAYSSLMLGAVAVATLIASVMSRGAVSGNNFLVFNRIAGSTWLGRPLLLLRGASALVLLSSAPIGLDRAHNVFAQLVLSTRPVLETCFLAWEATWIGYVVHELLLPLQSHRARSIGLLGTSLTWLALVIFDVGWPVSVTATVDRKCTISDVYYNVRCNSVTLQTGELSRLELVGLLQCVLVPSLWLLDRCKGHPKPQETKLNRKSSMLSVVGQAFLDPHTKLDLVGSLASGLIPFGGSTFFDLKLWRLLFLSPTAAMVMPMEPNPSMLRSRWVPRAWVVFGTVYVATAIFSSISYLGLAQGILTNDMIWPSFNMTGSHSYLANWFNEPAHLLGSKWSAIVLTNSQEINALGLFNQSQASVAFPIQQGARVQYSTLTALSDAISGLRALDACDGPWVFTQYCYLDFDQKWEMTNSVKRQERCKSMVTNGAVFLASLLRNVDISACWAESFEIGFASELRQSTAGHNLLASFSPPYLSINDEVSFWTQRNVTSYVLQWQNYKSIGLLHSYNIVNAYGFSHPFLLQSTAGYHRVESQTSFKMYWSVANDLGHLVTNTTTMAGKSLLRSSSQFAFQNASLQDVLVEAKVLPEMPWRANYVVLASYLGPFGSIDMVYVSVPSVLREAISTFGLAVAGARKLNHTMYLDILNEFYTMPAPMQWKESIYAVSGSVLCPDETRTYIEMLSWILAANAYQRNCAASYSAIAFVPSRDHILFGVLLAGIDAVTNVTSICLPESRNYRDHCDSKIRAALAFLPYLLALPNWRPSLYTSIHKLHIEWVQFGMVNQTAPIELFHTPLLDPLDPSFDFFAWLFFYDWAIGNREVISFQGDSSTLTFMGDTLLTISQPVDVAQLPTVFALYAFQAIRYVTYVMIMLAAVTFVYILLARGHVEGLNMFEMSRVGGIVWVGRPLVAVRSITALCLLSTASIELQSDVFSYFVTTPVPLLTTCLAANEVTWLVGIVNDISLVWTQDHTIAYATINSLLMWLISALLATLAPVQATITVSPSCEIATLDYQVVCVAGSVVIGSLERLLTLVGLVLICNGVCFGLVRCIWKRPSPHVSSSMLLCGGAKYLFEHHDWFLGDVYHLDRASAVLNGLLSVRYQNQWIVFDVKTWCVHAIKAATDCRVQTCDNLVLVDRRYGHTLPLRE